LVRRSVAKKLESSDADVAMWRVRSVRPVGWTEAFRLAIVVSLILFQNLAAAAAPARFAHFHSQSSAFSNAENCAPAHDDKTSPERPSAICSVGCILCDTGAHDAPSTPAPFAENAFYPGGSDAILRPSLAIRGLPIGWASSWSSRAPPRFS